MEYHKLGANGPQVSSLCIGALPMGPLQANLPVEEGGAIILRALERGVNFIDTAELYRTYPYVRWALERFNGTPVIATKSGAATREDMRRSIEKALDELGLERIDLFHLHAARDANALRTREGALEALLEAKAQGLIGAIGIASHSVVGVAHAAQSPLIDVVFALINAAGFGVLDGNVSDMIAAIARARSAGKGIYAMKALGGGTALADVAAQFEFVRTVAGVPVIAVGMLREHELEMNLALFEGRPVPAEALEASRRYRKHAKVTLFCRGCGRCAEGCHNGAISMVDGRAVIDPERCLLCGYCSSECPEFAIRVI